jgi:hypothetical protein
MLRAEPPRPKSSHFPLLVRFGFAGRWVLSRPRRFWARRRAVLTGPTSPRTIAVGGMGAGPHGGAEPLRDPVVHCSSSAAVCLARRFCLSPRFYPHLSEPAGSLPDGVPRFGGALLSLRRSRLDQDAERSLPHSDGYALLRCQPVLSFFPYAAIEFNPSSPISPSSSYAAFACLLFRSGSYTSPLIHKQCNSTDNFRATAITARFLAFFPPRSQRRSPKRRRSLSFPCGPRM